MGIIIGGFGPAGVSLALALASGGVDPREITILDTDIAPRAANPADTRILALNAGSRRFLTALGIWDHLASVAHPMLRIAISDSTLEARFRPLRLGFDAPDAGEPLAHLVPLGLIQQSLRQAVVDSGITLIEARYQRHRADETGVQVETSGEALRAGLLVGADGQRSPIRVQSGISVHGWPYQTAISAVVRHSGAHGGEALQHFLPAGPFAMLPLDEGRSSIVWSEDPQIAAGILAADREDQREEIERRAAGWRGEILAVEAISSHPLRLQLARRFIGERMALVADAAHVVHPLAGQGLNLGFEDAATLAELIVDHLRLGLDPGAPEMLEAYQARRRPAVSAMAFATDGINRLFSSNFPPLRLLREVGAGLVDRLPGLKSGAMRVAAGGLITPPRLFRGEAI
jgi:2-octaprenyl-6-methoxyphenol hydroxylase